MQSLDGKGSLGMVRNQCGELEGERARPEGVPDQASTVVTSRYNPYTVGRIRESSDRGFSSPHPSEPHEPLKIRRDLAEIEDAVTGPVTCV